MRGIFNSANVLIFVTLLCSPFLAADLGKQYPSTLDYSERPRGYECSNGEKDVWRLSKFDLAFDDDFHIEAGPSEVVFGCHETNVLWAVVFPKEPGTIASASHGKGERVTSIWLRFHPARIGELFPADTVIKQGDSAFIARAKQVAAHKINASYHVGPRAMVPPMNHTIVDSETREGPRRFYLIDAEAKSARYIDAFRTRPIPVGDSLGDGDAVKVFEMVWSAFDREYAMFAIKPRVDWQKLREQYRPRAARAKDNRELADVIAAMLAHLEDLHVHVQVDGEYVPGYTRERPLNANVKALVHLLGPLNDLGRDIDWTRTKDGIGYVSVDGLRDKSLPGKFEDVLAVLKDTRGLIVDLRFNGGGSEPLAREIAGCFLDRERVYAMSQYRKGPKHSDLGPKHERKFQPNKRSQYTKPVVVLQGQRTMSSAEAFALMLAQCPNVTTMGDRTAGSSGNPKQIEAGAGIIVNLPRWIPMDADGKSFDTTDVQPDVVIKASADDFNDKQDSVLSAALKRLRETEQPEAPAFNDGAKASRLHFLPGLKPVDKLFNHNAIPRLTSLESLTRLGGYEPIHAQFVSFVEADSAAESSEESEEVRRVEGRVLDQEGNGVAKADVWLPVRYIAKTTAHCQTDEGGQFVLEVPESWLSPIRSQNGSIAWAYKRGHAIATGSAQLALFSGMSNHTVELQLGKATDTSFVVLDPDGKPLPGAVVEPVHFRSSLGYSLVPPEIVDRVSAKTDKAGRARMPNMPREGFLNMKVVSKQFGTQQQRLNDKADAPAERAIGLQAVGRVTGRVISDDPKWSRGVRFHLTTSGRGDAIERTTGSAMVVTDDEGRFEVAALTDGELRIEGGVKQEAPVRAILPERQVITANKENELEIRLVKGIVVQGRIRTRDRGDPIAGARISIRYGHFRQGDHVVSDKDGRFTARVLPGPVYQQVIEIPPGYALTQVGAPWNERFEIPADAIEFKLPVIELVTTIKVAGRLIDQHGRPVVGVKLHGVKDGRRYGFSKTDKQGHFTMHLPKGMKMESYESWFDDQPQALGVKRETPLLLQATLPDRKVP